LIVGAPLYQVLLGIAAVRAVVREARGQRGWEKTAHTGAHLNGSRISTTAPALSQGPAA
jgi:hypothetical protein